jgi:[acyl-carrier-protein] S-malonyltransferase
MRPAQERLVVDLEATPFHDLTAPLINNWQAREIRTAIEAKQGLFEQVPNPVRWVETVRNLAAQGVTHAIEVGPGAVLCRLVRNIEPTIDCRKFGEAADWEKLAL